MLFEGRCGSTYLIEALNSHPQVDAGFEELRWLTKRGGGVADQIERATRLLTPPPIGPYAAIGFKTKLRDVLDPPQLAAVLRERRARVILLQRRNIIKWVVSSVNAERLRKATGDWNLYRAEDRLPPFAIDIPPFEARLARGEERHERVRDYVLHLELPTLSLYYEDLLTDERRMMRSVFSFLGVRYRGNRGRALKNTNDDLRSILLNFDELRAHYAGTRYEAMFDEVLLDRAERDLVSAPTGRS